MALFEKQDLPPGDWPDIANADQHFLSIRGMLKSQHDLTEGRGRVSNAGCLECYRQLVCRRIVDLTDAISLLWKAQLLVPCLIELRALLESVISLHHFVDLFTRMLRDGNWQTLHIEITKAVFSTRDKGKLESADLYETVNILTQFKKLFPEKPNPFMAFYEQISDHCHPNGYAMLQRYGDLIDFTFHAMPATHKREQVFVAVYNTTLLITLAEAQMREIDGLLKRIREMEPEPS